MKILFAADGSKYSDAAVEKCCEMFGMSNEFYAETETALRKQSNISPFFS